MNFKQHAKVKVFVITVAFFGASCSSDETETSTSEIRNQDTTVVDFWNGNRSMARQVYERKVLEAVLQSTESGQSVVFNPAF